jgi:hypothetical protein
VTPDELLRRQRLANERLRQSLAKYRRAIAEVVIQYHPDLRQWDDEMTNTYPNWPGEQA